MTEILPIMVADEDEPKSIQHVEPKSLRLRGYSPAVLLYPSLGMAILGGILTGIGPKTPSEPGSIGLIFSLFFFANLSVLAIQFTKKTTLLAGTLFVALIILSSISSFVDDMIAGVMSQGLFMNTTFYWMWFFFLLCLIIVSIVWSRAEYWTVTDGELIRHRIFRTAGTWPLTEVTYRADVDDVMRYILLRSGRLIIQPNADDGPIIIDNVVQIRQVVKRLEDVFQGQTSRGISPSATHADSANDASDSDESQSAPILDEDKT